ncbi:MULTISPECIES: subclass B1 metallo-beta-lactamase TMB-2 [Acinetobacter]|uniref:beta-lactamase n=2 Tax=Acinetobacter TaxID=469 RepID=L0N4W6_9GAMM|nr:MULTISPECIES: subclass B1 metallo-beta-lactamase TMB-2 [Acinetobacter]BAM73612.1 TMB-2 metallo-beta-lactamase [Acinetobacter pittii]BAM73613.1 TMB-2 metallo-beta-lactamase [Acinetobacter courvalinii]
MRPFLFLIIFISHFAFANEEIPGLEVEEIDNGVFLHKSYSRVEGWGLVSSNGLVVISGGKAFIIDTPWSESDTEKLVDWIRSKKYELAGSISTHSHEDKTAGIKWLNGKSITTYASALTNEILKREGKEQARSSFKGNEFSLMDGFLEVYYPGGGHTIDNLVVWIPSSKILYGGCFIRSLEPSGLGYTGEAKIDQWPQSARNTISKYPEAKIVVPGHGKIGDFELLKHTKVLAEKASNKANHGDR